MPKVNIIINEKGWILDRYAREIAKRVDNITIDTKPDPEADINHYLFWHPLIDNDPPTVATMWFTHLNVDWGDKARAACGKCVHIMCPSRHSKDVLIELGIPGEKITVVYPGIDKMFKPRPIRIGLTGRPYVNGRKGEYTLIELSWRMDLSPFHFIIVGPGWDHIVGALALNGVRVTYVPEARHEDYPRYIQEFDYYLSLAYAEGGPHGVLEALACGVPIISRPIGFAKDFGCAEYWTTEDLIGTLEALVEEHGPRRDLTDFTWDNWAKKHQEIWGGLTDEMQSD